MKFTIQLPLDKTIQVNYALKYNLLELVDELYEDYGIDDYNFDQHIKDIIKNEFVKLITYQLNGYWSEFKQIYLEIANESIDYINYLLNGKELSLEFENDED